MRDELIDRLPGSILAHNDGSRIGIDLHQRAIIGIGQIGDPHPVHGAQLKGAHRQGVAIWSGIGPKGVAHGATTSRLVLHHTRSPQLLLESIGQKTRNPIGAAARIPGAYHGHRLAGVGRRVTTRSSWITGATT